MNRSVTIPQRVRTARRLLMCAGGALIGVAAFSLSAAAVGSPPTISLTDTGPQPASLTVTVGDSITFVNTGQENHDIVASNGFIAPVLHPGESYSLPMNTPGRISYKQTGNAQTYKGSVVVVGGATTGQMSLSPSAPFVSYGAQVVLSGQASLPAVSGTVILASHASGGVHASRRCGSSPSTTQSGWTTAAGPLATSSAGTFSFAIRPTKATTYRVESADGQICSAAVTVEVRPLVTLRASSRRVATGRSVTLYARVQPAAASTALVLSRLDGVSVWRKLATAQTSPQGTARFSFVAAQGVTRLHVTTTARGGSRGSYLAASTQALQITGTGAAPVTGHPAKHHKKKH